MEYDSIFNSIHFASLIATSCIVIYAYSTNIQISQACHYTDGSPSRKGGRYPFWHQTLPIYIVILNVVTLAAFVNLFVENDTCYLIVNLFMILNGIAIVKAIMHSRSPEEDIRQTIDVETYAPWYVVSNIKNLDFLTHYFIKIPVNILTVFMRIYFVALARGNERDIKNNEEQLIHANAVKQNLLRDIKVME